ncbi:hypothetical protein [Pantoea ananatis]|uniref:hypothetical protein n=1 Tax=Pantoea ananas TaxID=553 RepID=UPI0012680356|nr:hypothetical protein [Pantoea ananatis]
MEARQVEVAAAESVEALRQSQATTEQVGQDNRARFRELLEQNGGTVTPEMKQRKRHDTEADDRRTD